ncbi:GMC family oxidoreductase [Streptosporangiaceae bacterium NEAU-GS5]|nr:GMC family oxidoreductase [Streptosporangiaceae bacterium NEAU-GS5]
MNDLTEMRRTMLRTLTDTVVPALPRDDDPTGFWATPGTATGSAELLCWWLENLAEPGFGLLLDGLAAMEFESASQEGREKILGQMAAFSPEAALGVQALVALARLFTYAAADNPLWPGIGYPGPQAQPRADADALIVPYVPGADETLHCDVVVVGSGAGGGTIAGTLAANGRDVVVLEAGGAHTARDFQQLELWANLALLYRGGPVVTADGNAVLFAGATLGGGTTVNWQNWVTPAEAVRAEWAGHGMPDIATAEFDRHIAAVSERVGASRETSDLNGPHRRMIDGARRLDWRWRRAVRNADPATYDPGLAGFTHYGDLTGSKRGTLTTYLADAHAAGARILTDTRAQRIITADGRAQGVIATFGGRTVTVRAKHVVVACGALETPALLLRSGIGGPAVGTGLRVHPAALVFGEYADKVDGWWGPPQAAVIEQFRDDGVLIENSHYHPGGWATLMPWDGGRAHKEAMSRLAHTALFLGIVRDQGAGRVTVDENGQAVHHYPMDDAGDLDRFRTAMAALIRLHEAAGAERIRVPLTGFAPWSKGEDLESWIAAARELPIGAGGIMPSSAHQMGTARIGTDPATSVARPSGELHDTGGVWIGDTSAFPTASGANPMCACMALAHRTAEQILDNKP